MVFPSTMLLLSFAVWQVWSVVVAKLPQAGFTLATDELFWLAALPGLLTSFKDKKHPSVYIP